MKIAFLSDFHLGFSQKGRENEAFENAFAAMKLAVERGAQAIVIAGDIFDKEVPESLHLIQAFSVFSIAKNANKNLLIVKKISSEKERELKLNGIPIFAIHGTHEFRSRDYANYLQLFEEAGFIAYLHGERALFEQNGELIAIHGLGGVPEKKALDVLRAWNPKPEPKAFNILVLHQSFKEFLPFDDEMIATLTIDSLPEGFDIIVNGHLHWQNEVKQGNKHLILTGSTMLTQMKRLEAKKPKGIYIMDTKSKALDFLHLPNQRPFIYEKLEFENAEKNIVAKRLREVLGKITSEQYCKMPLVKIKLSGSLAKGHTPESIDIKDILDEYSKKAIISIDSDFFAQSFSKKLSELVALQEKNKSVLEFGYELLEKKLGETNFNNAFDARKLFSMLEADDIDGAKNYLLSLGEEKSKVNIQNEKS
ncbi:MAG: DNA repair exonuclease [Candidatus Diapherotrites archaeon]|nr:DNA repair exonuclease [Candidatus Diapherotrites archaeon]